MPPLWIIFLPLQINYKEKRTDTYDLVCNNWLSWIYLLKGIITTEVFLALFNGYYGVSGLCLESNQEIEQAEVMQDRNKLLKWNISALESILINNYVIFVYSLSYIDIRTYIGCARK